MTKKKNPLYEAPVEKMFFKERAKQDNSRKLL